VQQLEILVEQSRGGEIAKPSSRCQFSRDKGHSSATVRSPWCIGCETTFTKTQRPKRHIKIGVQEYKKEMGMGCSRMRERRMAERVEDGRTEDERAKDERGKKRVNERGAWGRALTAEELTKDRALPR
jgi:hypothetical protein